MSLKRWQVVLTAPSSLAYNTAVRSAEVLSRTRFSKVVQEADAQV